MSVELGTMPVRKSLTVALEQERAFELFTARIGEWWPTATHSIHGDRVAEVVVEGRVGGRIFERSLAGEEALWASILAWEPPRRLVLEWRVDPTTAATEVEVRFEPVDGGGTRVELVHRGWERLAERAEERRGSYESGWEEVLGRYARHAG